MDDNKETTDEQLAYQIQQGDKEKFGIIMNRYEKKLSRYGRKFISNTQDTEDLIQDIFIKTYENILSFDTKRKFSSWIYKIAHNIFINELKKKKTISFNIFDIDTFFSHPSHERFSEKKIIDEEIKSLINNSLKNLPIKHKEVLILYYMEELSYKEISDILEIPTGTVGIRLQRAKKLLKKQIPHNTLKR